MKTLSRSRHDLPRPRIFPGVCASPWGNPKNCDSQACVFSFLPTLLAATHPRSYPRRRALSLGFVVMGQRSLTGSPGLPACTCRRRKREDRRGGSEHRDRRPYRHYQCLRAWRLARTSAGLGRRASSSARRRVVPRGSHGPRRCGRHPRMLLLRPGRRRLGGLPHHPCSERCRVNR